MPEKAISGGQKGARNGRKGFRPTEQQRQSVRVAASAGYTEARLAGCLNMAVGTLRKHFGEELKRGRDERDLKVVRALYESAIRGNAAAQKAYLKGADRVEAAERRERERRSE